MLLLTMIFQLVKKNAIKPIYEDLSKKTLLHRCVRFTQNNNENYNQLIWKINPKIISRGFIIIELAAYIAVCIYVMRDL